MQIESFNWRSDFSYANRKFQLAFELSCPQIGSPFLRSTRPVRKLSAPINTLLASSRLIQ